MPEFRFDPSQNIVICHAEITGPKRELSLKMALDTGATFTMIPIEAALAIGCNPLKARRKIDIITGGSIEYVPVITIPKFRAFGFELRNMEVVIHNLSTQSPVEGLLGLNFLKKAGAVIDFSKNIVKIYFRD